MNTETIKQIQKIAGVKTVELAGKYMAVVVFEAVNEKEQAIIEEAKRRGFVMGAKHGGVWNDGCYEIIEDLNFKYGGLYGGTTACIYEGGIWAELIPEKPKPLFVTEDGVKIFEGDMCWFIIKDNIMAWHSNIHPTGVMPNRWYKTFSTEAVAQAYIQKQQQPKATDQAKCGCMNSLSTWIREELNKLKSLRPEDLVDGEIYISKRNISYPRIIRVKKGSKGILHLYSQIDTYDGKFWGDTDGFISGDLYNATLEEKQQLITMEVLNGYFHGVN